MYEKHKDLYNHAKRASENLETTRQLLRAAEERNKQDRKELLKELQKSHDERLAEETRKFKAEIERQNVDAKRQLGDLKDEMENQKLDLENEMKLRLENEERLLKIIEKRNYEAFHPVPEILKNHKLRNPKAFYIQILGCRGAGKSTFINHCMAKSRFYSFLHWVKL